MNQELDFQDREYMHTLNDYELLDLKHIFFYLLQINVPQDIFYETDEEYIKHNISCILLYYFHEKLNNRFLNLANQFYKCKRCNFWSYKITQVKGICILCLTRGDKREAWF